MVRYLIVVMFYFVGPGRLGGHAGVVAMPLSFGRVVHLSHSRHCTHSMLQCISIGHWCIVPMSQRHH